MSAAVFPTLAGLGWEINRTPVWKTRLQESVSGKQTSIADWSYPRWQWELTYDFLRQGTVHGSAYAEFAQLAGFFNQRQGQFDSFLYQDADDDAVTGQALGTGDGTTTAFQLIRPFGGFIEPVLAPNTISHVYLNGVNQPSGWSVSNWGVASPGVVTFSSPPGNGVVITADFSFYFPCRFTDDTMSFAKFMSALYDAKKVAFASIK
ncbi:MAG: DUF2460 domain-containing protein [Planctomycetes bacterium]|nr:DUF2460 domain-containing protein [Planctomycetota bacterium]